MYRLSFPVETLLDGSLLPGQHNLKSTVLHAPWGCVIQVSNYFAPTDKAKQEGYNAYLTDKNAERLATALCRMRGAALKLGQMLSIQDEGVLPPQVHRRFLRRQKKGCIVRQY